MEGPPRPVETPEDEDEGKLLPKKEKRSAGEGFMRGVIERSNEIGRESRPPKADKLREWSRKFVLPGVVSEEGNSGKNEVKIGAREPDGPESDTLIINREAAGRTAQPDAEPSWAEEEFMSSDELDQEELLEGEIAFETRHEVKKEKSTDGDDAADNHQATEPTSEIHHISEVIKDKSKHMPELSHQRRDYFAGDKEGGIQRRAYRTALPYSKAVYAGFAGALLILLIVLMIYLVF